MDFEKPKQELADNKEQQEDAPEGSLLKKANRLLDHMNIPNKETVKKWLAGALAGTAAMTAVETQNVEDNTKEIDIEKKFTPIVQKAIEESRTKMSFQKDPNTNSVAARLGVPVEKVNDGAMYTTSSESLNEDTVMNHSYNRDVPMSGDNMYFVSKNALAVAEDYKENDVDGESVNLFNEFKSDVRTFTFDGVEIEPIGQVMNFEAIGVTKSEAILEALEEGVGFVHGSHIQTKQDLKTEKSTNFTNYNVDEEFTDFSSSITEGFIDHYEVESIQKDEDGRYRAKLKITFGQRPEYQLPDSVQLADGSKKSYYEINPDDEK